jgi:hypothetical protein
VAAAFIYIWTNVLVFFFQKVLHGDYSFAHLLVLLVPFAALNVTFVFSMLKVPSIAAELFGGMGSAGAQVAGSIVNAARAAMARAAI